MNVQLKPCTDTLPEIAEDLFKKAEDYYSAHKKFSDEILQALSSIFKDILKLSFELLDKARLVKFQAKSGFRSFYKIYTKYEEFCLFEGVNFCTCDIFKTDVAQKKFLTCQHFLAIKLGLITEKFRYETLSDDLFIEHLNSQFNF